MGRGRPVYSAVRQRIVEILAVLGKSYGYDIYKIYKEIYPKVTLRLLYYHLKKGCDLGEFQIQDVKKESGEYSWGNEVEKIYYALGVNAQPQGDSRIGEFLDSKK
jgi:hypothetical protein